MISLAGCGGNNSPADGNTLGQVRTAAVDVGGGAEMSETVAQLLAAGLNESDPALQGMQRLSGPEISRLIAERTLMEDRRGLRGMPYPQGEHFFGHGIVGIQLDRHSVQGAYSVQSDALCIVPHGARPPSCRAIYRNPAGRLFQVFYGAEVRVTPILMI
jgi:hypothetical protein